MGFDRIFRVYLEGRGYLVSRLIAPISHIVTLLVPNINLLTKSPLTLQVESRNQVFGCECFRLGGPSHPVIVV